jgi:hypothetical protein
MSDGLAAFEHAVIAQGPPGLAVAGAVLSPDGKYGAALTRCPSVCASLIDDVSSRELFGVH